ncbi:hypothetical protein D3C71_1820830 [compost metagenome]
MRRRLRCGGGPRDCLRSGSRLGIFGFFHLQPIMSAQRGQPSIETAAYRMKLPFAVVPI